jgi:hypothetical protein
MREPLVFPQSSVRMNYTEFAGAVSGVAKGLWALGIKLGELRWDERASKLL